jgi:hypothetical protein
LAAGFPWLFESQFELGTNAEWTSETDTVNQLDYPSWRVLARYPWLVAPYTGAYSARVALTGGTADAFVNSTSITQNTGVTQYYRFAIWFSPTFTATADDTWHILELQGAANAVTSVIGARIVAATNVINLGIGGTTSAAVPTVFTTMPILRGVWYTVEAKILIVTGGTTGTMDLYVTRDGQTAPGNASPDATIATGTIQNIAVTSASFGVRNQLATTTGVYLLDALIVDDGRVYPAQRYQVNPVLTTSGHAFVGPGWIAGAAILQGTTGVMTLFDTDSGDTTSSQSYTDYFDSTHQTSIGGNIYFQHGCYVQLSGTNPVGQVLFVGKSWDGVLGPLYYSDGGLNRLANGG